MLQRLIKLVLGIASMLCVLNVAASTLAELPLTLEKGVPSNVLFDLSVEFPTANTAAYQDASGYTEGNLYLGLFDAEKCYDYDGTNAWFNPVSLANGRACTGHWSGNFLNWATMTGLDEFRYAMTGGNRYMDTASLTVLERTYQSGQGGTSNFTDKTYTGSSATPFANSLKIVNAGQQNQVSIEKTSACNSSCKASYYVRVKVCDINIGLEANCEIYGTSTYKPVGEVQRNGEKMRFGLFSYYNAHDIDNAVMRSKLKYVAPLKWTSTGSIANPNAEWSASTGIFVGNPDPTEASNSYGGSVANSGVINYINKFGSASGGYKTYDNVGKLYYESLKYLRGLGPTVDFYQQSNSTNNDNFPVISSWDDPVQHWCQKNYIITMGDTHTHCEKRLPGGSSTSYGPGYCNANGQTADQGSLGGDTGVNVTTLTNALGAAEGVGTLGANFPGNNKSFYMSGLAYWAAKDGFRTLGTHKMKAKSFVIDVQEYGDKGSPDANGIASEYWYTAKYGGVEKFDGNGKTIDETLPGQPNQPTPDSWWTTIDGFTGKWPKTLLPAGKPDKMIEAVRSALQSIAAESGSASAVGLSSTHLTNSDNGVNVFSATYNPNEWSGDVASIRIVFAANGGTTTVNNWKASDRLNPGLLNQGTGTPPWKTRRIITFNDGLLANGTANTEINGRQGVDFVGEDTTGTDRFAEKFSGRQQYFLNMNPASPTMDTDGSKRVDYLRGDNSNEGTSGKHWRIRAGSVGDIINSSAVYVHTPSFSDVPAADFASFISYATAVNTRTPVVYVGSNDGMLHAFDASENATDGSATANSGKELLAYIPAAVYSRLNQLTLPNYSHKYYVDATPVVADAQLSSSICNSTSDPTKCWRTVVAGGLNAGGQGIYALDGTHPANFAGSSAKSLVFWEFTDRDDPDLGYTFARPVIRKMNNGKWAVIVGNGYNNIAADGSVSTSGQSYVFILMLDGPGYEANGRGKPWVLGTNYFKIALPAPDSFTVSPNDPSGGLSTVYAVDKDDDNKVDYLYAGDRFGYLWKVDVRSASPSNWKSAFGSLADPLPLFSAKSSDTAERQQITTSPLVVPHPRGGFMVLFGTGSSVDIEDSANNSITNSFYGIWDKGDGTRVTARSQLQKQAVLAASGDYTLQSNCIPQYDETPADPQAATDMCPSSLAPPLAGGKVAQQLGWVLDLHSNPSSTQDGERYISSALPNFNNGLLGFVSLTPSDDICGGTNTDVAHYMNYLTGATYENPIYYIVSNGTVAAAEATFTYSANGRTVTTTSSPPSGRKLTSGSGQNTSDIHSKRNPDSAKPSTGCTPFIAGQPCRKLIDNTCPFGTTLACEGWIRSPPTGRVSWRHITR